jgi:phosphatidylglycerol:prolipoprotein diacylglycerol transferase
VGRFWIEALRTDQLLIPGIGFPISQLLGAVLAVIGLIAIMAGHKRAKNK